MKRIESSLIYVLILFLLAFGNCAVFGQSDSVEVTFNYRPSDNPGIVYLPGEFNTPLWQVNSSTAMTKNALTGTWSKTVKLRVGGPASGGTMPGVYQYKFNEDGSKWLNDPLNWRTNQYDNNNSYVVATNPLVFYLLPKYGSSPSVVKTSKPEISAYFYHSPSTSIDTSKIHLLVNGSEVLNVGSYFDPNSNKFSYIPSDPLSNGTCRVRLECANNLGAVAYDTTVFVVQGGFVQIFTQPNDQIHFPTKRIEGSVEDGTVTNATLVRNETDSNSVVVSAGLFSTDVTLKEGVNTYKAVASSGGQTYVSSPVRFNYIVDHTPEARFIASHAGVPIIFMNQSTDPDGDSLTYRWTSDDSLNPVALHFSSTAENPSLAKPSISGEYYFTLEAIDRAGNVGKARNYFTVDTTGGVSVATTNTNPQWVKDAIVYEIFVRAYSNSGDLAGILQRLPYLKTLGVNVLWLTPIMVNRGPVNEMNGGYDIVDFYNVAPQFGNLASFRTLADSAHRLGIRIILDITPNHVSDQHPWVNDIRAYGRYSNYRSFVETRLLGDSRGMGQSLTYQGGEALYARYDGWGLANLDVSDPEARIYMTNMLRWWVTEQHADGFRMDVYWGPQNRYGKDAFWRPFREEIKNIKPDIFVLGETDGTGTGSEINYADGGGACDAAYDWNFYGTIKNTLSGGNLNDLDSRVTNFGYSPGPNSYFLRFLENHDETRIAQSYSIEQTKVGATTVFTIPGIPMIYAGQEVGWKGRRDLIDFDNPSGKSLFPFYQRLARIRTLFPALRARDFKRVTSSEATVYSFIRPYRDQNSVVAINFSNQTRRAGLSIDESNLSLSSPHLVGKSYYLNDILNDTTYLVTKSSLMNFEIDLRPWSSAVMVLADSTYRLPMKVEDLSDRMTPSEYRLFQNYPNPFNPQTTISYQLAGPGEVQLSVLDVLGREVAALVKERQAAGRYSVGFAAGRMATGLYFYRLSVISGSSVSYSSVKKMLLVK